jgi:hypothetical protein
VNTGWQTPAELPDLRHAGVIALDIETRDDRLGVKLGSGWPFHDGHVCGVSVAWRAGGNIQSTYIPLRHPDSDNVDPGRVFTWLADLVTSDVRIVTQNGGYDWGWLHAEAGIKMPSAERLEEIGALATLADENRRRYSLDALRGLPGKDTALLHEGAADAPKPSEAHMRFETDEDGYKSRHRQRGHTLKTYVYRDKDGAPHARVTRTTTKNFFQSHWENGAWVDGAPAVRVPYRLPELLAAKPEEPVHFTEGEKDADGVAALGFVATTLSGGAKAPWPTDCGQWFAGKKVAYVYEDNDAPGRTFALRIAKALSVVVSEVRIVRFPELPEKGDVCDWLADFGATRINS